MKHLFIALLLLFTTGIYAQNTMRIHYNNGTKADIPLSEIDNITIIDSSEQPIEETSLLGSWLWGNREQGYYELITFNTDNTYTGYDNYFSYGFDTQTFGFYSYFGSMLILQSNGYGYNRRYNWLVTTLTENALEVITNMGKFVYYKLQPEVISLKVGGTLSCGTNESFVFTDGVTVTTNENNLVGIKSGTTYILKAITTEKIVAYKVVVSA